MSSGNIVGHPCFAGVGVDHVPLRPLSLIPLFLTKFINFRSDFCVTMGNLSACSSMTTGFGKSTGFHSPHNGHMIQTLWYAAHCFSLHYNTFKSSWNNVLALIILALFDQRNLSESIIHDGHCTRWCSQHSGNSKMAQLHPDGSPEVRLTPHIL